VLANVIEGVEELDNRGFIHRKIIPQNIVMKQ
jgi:serine/threonine protein kinase